MCGYVHEDSTISLILQEKTEIMSAEIEFTKDQIRSSAR